MPKIFHEMPLAMLINGDEYRLADGHYALVHLYDESADSGYYEYTVRQLKAGRDVILDNSVFELGQAFSAERFAYWIEQLVKDAGYENVQKYLVYIIPDVLDNFEATIDSARSFINQYSGLPGKRMVVVQGKTFEELLLCYRDLSYLPDIYRIGISFNCEAYNTIPEDQRNSSSYTTMLLHAWMAGRSAFIDYLVEEYGYQLPVPLHMLGCSLPQEFKNYWNYTCIVSVDTSNPIVHGLHKIAYTENGLHEKLPMKLVDLMHKIPTAEEMSVIEHNCKLFRRFVNG